MTINDYYLRELNSLRKMGEEFAHKNPGLAPYLAKEGLDPDVERMLEGFAFLTGRLRQQLDEELPEVSHSLGQLLWPNYIRPIPSYSVIAYEPLREESVVQRVAKGNEVHNEATNALPECKFMTAYNVDVHPVEIAQCRYFVYGSKSELEIDFAMSSKDSLSSCKMESIRIFLNGTKIISEELYVYFLRFVESLELEILDYKDETVFTVGLEQGSITPVGFDKQERMLPYPENIYDGYIVLQEYFAFVQKYMFVDINGLKILQGIDREILSQNKKFRLRVRFDRRFNIAQSVTKENLILYATPVVNLFKTDAIPIRKTSYLDEYMLSPSEYERHECEVFLVESVRGWIPEKNSYEDFESLDSFLHSANDEYYSVRMKLSDDGERTHSYIRFASTKGAYERGYAQATVSVKLLATNRSIPAKLRLGDICYGDPHSSSAHLKFKNITIASISYPPPIGGDFLWKMISNMALNYLSLSDITTFCAMLESYDFLGVYDTKVKATNNLMLQGLKSIQFEKSEMIFEGFPIRGTNVFVDVDLSKFTGIGGAYLFCSVINEFLALYGTMNSFHRMDAKLGDYGVFSWEPRLNQKKLV